MIHFRPQKYIYNAEKRPWPYNFLKWYKTYVYGYETRLRAVEIEAVLLVTWEAAGTEGEHVLKRARYKLKPRLQLTLSESSQQAIKEGLATRNEEPKVPKLEFPPFDLPIFSQDEEPSADRPEPISVKKPKYKKRPFTIA